MSLDPRIGPLFTDFYELTMAAGYFDHQIVAEATFSVFLRENPEGSRGYYVAAGLDDILEGLENFRFSDDDIRYLKETARFADDFLDYLRSWRYRGSVHAMAEGTIFFPDEPILELTAPIIDAQIVETFVLNAAGLQTLLATKAARCVHVAEGRPLIDFSLRRTQGVDAGLKVARCTYIAGFPATSNVLGGKLYDIPVSGTMAHSFVSAFSSELEAFRAFADTFPDQCVLLIDTYDTLDGARNAVTVARELRSKGKSLLGVRLDSGDMATLSRQVRQILDEAGFEEVKIFASSGFDEFKIERVLSEGARIDAFGVGTKIGVSADLPYLDIVYKLVRYDGRDVRKLSPGKVTLAGKKQVFRFSGPDGRFREDVIGRRDETMPSAEPLLDCCMVGGRRTRPPESLDELRRRFQQNFACLDAAYKPLVSPAGYPVRISPALRRIQQGETT